MKDAGSELPIDSPCKSVYDIADMTIQYCESRICDVLLFRVVEIQRICEATATPLLKTEGANLSELLFAG